MDQGHQLSLFSGQPFHQLQRANAIADCLVKITEHDLSDNNERRVETTVQALIEAVDNEAQENIRSREVVKLLQSLKLRKASRFDGIPNYA
jgi:hypothetical protein